MIVLQYVLGSALIAMAVALVLLVLFQSDKDTRMSGTISGGSSDTYYGQNKGRSRDKVLSLWTIIVGILFVGTLMAAYILYARYC
jgi:preprotein translocase subunit SecG